MDFWRRAGHREDDGVGGLGGDVGLGEQNSGGGSSHLEKWFSVTFKI